MVLVVVLVMVTLLHIMVQMEQQDKVKMVEILQTQEIMHNKVLVVEAHKVMVLLVVLQIM